MGPRILIVEDDAPRRTSLEKAAENLWFVSLEKKSLISVDNLHDATAEINGYHPFDLVIMGWDFPTSRKDCEIKENGGKLLELVRERGLQAIVCTNRADQLTKDELCGTSVISPVPFGSIEDRLRCML